MTPMVDEALVFGACDPMVGVLSRPGCKADIGVVVVVGGRQYRVGAHRQFVSLARRIAGAGMACLRFDVRGMGDSPGDRQSFESIDDDIERAIGALRDACPDLRRIVLWGLCDGATASLLFTMRNPAAPVGALCLVNPWLHDEQAQATARVGHYYPQRLRDPAFWRKLLSGNVDIAGSLRGWRVARDTSRESELAQVDGYVAVACKALSLSDVPIQVVIAEADLTAQEFLAAVGARAAGALSRPNVRLDRVAAADHTFSTGVWQSALEAAVLDWLSGL